MLSEKLEKDMSDYSTWLQNCEFKQDCQHRPFRKQHLRRFEGGNEISHTAIWRKNNSGKGNSHSKGPEEGAHIMCLRNSKRLMWQVQSEEERGYKI